MKDRRGLRSVPTSFPPEPISGASPSTGELPPHGELEDFQLVRRFKYEADAAAFEALFRRHQQYIANLCLSLLRSQSEAEDAVQEVFIKAYRGLVAFEPTITFRGWLYRIAVNHCRDLLQQRGRRNEESDEEALAAVQQRPQQEAGLVATLLLEAALARLKPTYRTAFVLQAVEGYSIAEVARALDIGFDAAASRLRRAYQQFTVAYEALNRKAPSGK